MNYDPHLSSLSSYLYSSLFKMPKPKPFKALSNFDIDNAMNDLPHYGGCYSKDKLPKKLDGKCYVLNLQNQNDGGGTHWTYLDDRRPKEVQYFDSEGANPPRRVQQLMRATGKKGVINDFMIQPINSEACGYYCILAAHMLDKPKGMASMISLFNLNDPDHNDNVLRQFFKV